MRLRNAASGHDASSTGDNINVAMPSGQDSSGGPPRKRIKLKFTKSSPPEKKPAPVPLFPRPKRQSAGKVKYTEDGLQAESEPQSVKSLKRKAMPSSDSMLSSPPKIHNSTDPTDDNDEPSGYSMDFLANFIDDVSPSSVREDESSSKSNGQLSITSSDPANGSLPISSDGLVKMDEKAARKKPQRIESPAACIKKLQVACHALDALNISAGPLSQSLPSSPSQQDNSVDKLIFAAASSPAAKGKPPPTVIGSMDEDMGLLLKNAIQIFRSNVVTKNQLAGRMPIITKSGHRPKRNDKGAHSTDKERFAMTALEDLLEGSATNVNCVISRERLHLMWQLYRQLQSLVMSVNMNAHAPVPNHYGGVVPQQMILPNESSPGMLSLQPLPPHQFMHHPDILQHQHMQQMGPPSLQARIHSEATAASPHQFLFRKGQQGHEGMQHSLSSQNYGKAGMGMEKMKVHPGGVMSLPRSGQNMQLNFHHSGLNQLPPGMGQPMGPPPQPHPQPVMMAHPGMHPPPGYDPSLSTHGGTPVSVSGTPMQVDGGYMTGSPAGHSMAGGPIMVGGPVVVGD